MSDKSSTSKLAGRLLRWGLCGLVLWFVVDRAIELWQQSPDEFPPISIGWLLIAAVCYIAGWLPSVWFMRALLTGLGQKPGWVPLSRAYYCGHLGKYVPGKAAVLLIRSGMLRPHGIPVAQSALGVVIETLGVMAVGLAMAAALSGWAFPPSVWEALPEVVNEIRVMKWIGPVVVGVGALVLIPLCSGLASRIAGRLATKELASIPDQKSGEAESSPVVDPSAITSALLMQGTLAFTGAWFLFGLSLGCVLLGLGYLPGSAADWLHWTCAVSAGTSLGFIVLFAPGGLGVREGLIIAVLEPSVGGKLAIAAAALLRVIWFASEVAVAAILYFAPIVLKTRSSEVSPSDSALP